MLLVKVYKLIARMNCTALQGRDKRIYYPFRALAQRAVGLKPGFFVVKLLPCLKGKGNEILNLMTLPQGTKFHQA